MAERIIIAFDISDNRPHKAVRIYTVKGEALGYGELLVAKEEQAGDLFSENSGFIKYSATIDIDKLIKAGSIPSNKSPEKPKSKEEQLSDSDVESTDDIDEDNFVRRSVYQLRQAKATVNLMTIQELREEYRKMKQKRNAPKPDVPVKDDTDIPKKTIEEKGEDILKTIADEESKVDVVSTEEYDDLPPWEVAAQDLLDKPTTYTPTDEFAPLTAYVGDNGKFYLANGAYDSFTRQQMLEKQESMKEVQKRSEAKSKKDEPKKDDLNLDDFFKGLNL